MPRNPSSAEPPWKMWGTSVPLNVAGTVASVERASQQVARVSYKRPENWRFFIRAALIGGDAPAVNPMAIRIRVDLFFGVGRAVTQTQQPTVTGIIQEAFAFFTWLVPAGVAPQEVQFSNKYVTQVRTPPTIDTDLTTRQTIDHLPADNIQAQATLTVVKSEPLAVQSQVEVFFAPNVHVRPDWWEGQFLGDEVEGT